MPSVEANRAHWTRYGWDEGGDEWSTRWGGTAWLWETIVRPRVEPFLDVPTIVEIGAGYGRLSEYLARRCDRLVLVDLTPKCVEACRRRFASFGHVEHHLTDGVSLPVDDHTVDFVFSFDALVHADLRTMRSYCREIARVLRPGGVAFVHHSNFGETRRLSDPPPRNRHWRGGDVSARLVREVFAAAGIACFRQERVAWDESGALTDCFTFARSSGAPGSCEQRTLPVFFRTKGGGSVAELVTVDLAGEYVVIEPDGGARAVAMQPGPPPRVPGYTIGGGLMTHDPPHGGELHPDGEEILIVMSGVLDVVLDQDDGEHQVTLTAGTAAIVPRNTWHRTIVREPAEVVFITPGPGGEHRPL